MGILWWQVLTGNDLNVVKCEHTDPRVHLGLISNIHDAQVNHPDCSSWGETINSQTKRCVRMMQSPASQMMIVMHARYDGWLAESGAICGTARERGGGRSSLPREHIAHIAASSSWTQRLYPCHTGTATCVTLSSPAGGRVTAWTGCVETCPVLLLASP